MTRRFVCHVKHRAPQKINNKTTNKTNTHTHRKRGKIGETKLVSSLLLTRFVQGRLYEETFRFVNRRDPLWGGGGILDKPLAPGFRVSCGS